MKYQFSYCRLIGTLGLIFTIVFVTTAGGELFEFIHFPSLVFVLGVFFFLMLGAYEKEFLSFIPHSFRVLFFRPVEANQRFAEIALFGSRVIIGAGTIAMIIAIVQMLRSLSIPQNVYIGLSIALAAPLFALIVSEIFLAFVHQSFKEKKSDNNMISLKNAGVPLVLIFFILAVTFILLFGSPNLDVDNFKMLNIIENKGL